MPLSPTDSQPAMDGTRAWFVLAAGFVSSIICHGVPNAMGVYFMDIQSYFDIEKGTTTLLVGLPIIMMTLSGLLSSLFYGVFGSRGAILIGGVLASIGCAGAYFVAEVWQLACTQVLFGIGSGIIVTPVLAVQTEYFEKYIHFALVILSIGGAVGMAVWSPACAALINALGWQASLLVCAAIALNQIPCALIMRPYHHHQIVTKNKQGEDVEKPIRQNRGSWKDLFDIGLLKNPLFLVTMLLAFVLFGNFIVYITMLSAFMTSHGFTRTDGASLLGATGLASLVGRVCAAVATRLITFSGCIVLGISLCICGLQLILLTICTQFWHYTLVCIAFGFAQGTAIAYGPPTFLEMFGAKHKFHRVIGMSSFFIGITMLAIPQIVGRIAEKSIDQAFVYVGLVSLGGALGFVILGLWLHLRHKKDLRKTQRQELEDMNSDEPEVDANLML